MLTKLEDLAEISSLALDHLKMQKLRDRKAYNKRIKFKTFSKGELIMKVILLIGLKDPKLGKCSPNWEGQFEVHKVLKGGRYH